ncbi:winged helix-turn-helix transcriptional regulator [Paraburkholderia diazotrophica]|uniref:Transcriptional regulator, HxlR family n=1 Tax=Paraburkholderia diazotrophica TaxID=667676 RepID=A0A1H7C968_9BURK|nr:winged helix-turn-helix transcriptional regulator [Paraburkholderia diazotrophica]SEJ85117.1 transcriptional regulator, HxlR family [Paraburkholderia diazotrophica]
MPARANDAFGRFLIKRTVYAVMPPHAEYELTPLGRPLTEPVIALGTWASDPIRDIDVAREAFDAQERIQGDSPVPFK